MFTKQDDPNVINPTIYLYYIHNFSIKEISYIQSMEEKQVEVIIQMTSQLIKRWFVVRDAPSLKYVVTKIIEVEKKFEPLNEQQSKHIYENIMHAVKKRNTKLAVRRTK